jgi:hypothetical protein
MAPSAEPPVAARPSQEDLAALDQILNPRNQARGATLEKSVATAAASPPPRPARPGSSTARRSAPSRLPLIAGAALALAVVAGAGWFFFLRPGTAAQPGTAVAAVPTTTMPAPVGGEPAPTLAPATVPAAAPSTPPVTSTPVTTTPAATDARALLQAGSYPQAARAFASDLKAAGRSAATIQLFTACATESIEKAVASVGAMELVIIPRQMKGKSCYVVCWGIYPTPQAATPAMRNVPAYFEQPGVSRKVVRAAEILP